MSEHPHEHPPPGNRPVAVVTGGTAGVGRATARQFAAGGYDVAVLARGEDRLDATQRELTAAGTRALAIRADVADAAGVDRAAERIESELGPIDVWINNAMTSVFSEAHDVTDDEYRRVMAVNFHGVVHGTLSALRRMEPRGRGSIVQVGSALAYRGIPLQAAYCASKHAVKAFTESLLVELEHRRSPIRLCMVHLPAVNTPQFEWVKSRLPRRAQPVPPIYQPEVPAEAIHWAAHHARRELFVGVPTVRTVWGNFLAPSFVDRYLASNGYDGQQTDEPEDPRRPHNLFEPVSGDWAAHGRFDDRARNLSPHFELVRHRRAVGAAGGVAAGLAIAGAVIALLR